MKVCVVHPRYNQSTKLEYLNPPEITIIESGYVSLDKRWRHSNVSSTFSCLYFVKEGEGVIEYDNEKIVLEKNHAYFIPPEIVYKYYCDDRLIKLYMHINIFGRDGFDILSSIKTIKICEIDPNDLDEMIKLYGSESFADSLLFRSHLNTYISKFIGEHSDILGAFKNYSSTVKSAMNYIQKNLSYALNLNDIAKSIFASEATLRKRFKAETGMTIHRYIEELIFSRSKILLSSSDITIKEISETLGFKDQFYFTARFKKLHRLSPKAYRETHKTKHSTPLTSE